MTDTEAQPAGPDPSASQPTPTPIGERRCDFVPFPGSGAAAMAGRCTPRRTGRLNGRLLSGG